MAGGVRTCKDNPGVDGLEDVAMFWEFGLRAELNKSDGINTENLSNVDKQAFRDSSDPQSHSTDESFEVPVSPPKGMPAPLEVIQIRLVDREVNISFVPGRTVPTVQVGSK